MRSKATLNIQALTKSTNDRFTDIILQAASVLFLLGLLTGIYVTMVATGKVDADLTASLAAHLNAIIGALIVLSLLLILPNIRYGHAYKMNMLMMFIIANYSNWLITLIKSFLNVKALGFTSNGVFNNIIYIALIVFVVIPSLVGAVMWVVGTFRSSLRLRTSESNQN